MKHLKELVFKISANKNDLIKTCIIYPFILIIHYLSGILLYNFPSNLKDTLINELKLIFAFALQFNFLLIISILAINYIVKNSIKDINIVLLLMALYLPFAFIGQPKMYLLICLVVDYYVCWVLVIASKKWKSISVLSFKISSQWIGFLGTVVSALISALFSKK